MSGSRHSTGTYRGAAVERVMEFEGRGVWYWACPVEARICPQQRIALIGGGNSAGQAAVYISGHAESILFLGAEPESSVFGGCPVAVDRSGFVLTGASVAGRRTLAGLPAAFDLETSMPGVFAVGDIRSGSVKRVGAAIGEGAAVVSQIHRFLAQIS